MKTAALVGCGRQYYIFIDNAIGMRRTMVPGPESQTRIYDDIETNEVYIDRLGSPTVVAAAEPTFALSPYMELYFDPEK